MCSMTPAGVAVSPSHNSLIGDRFRVSIPYSSTSGEGPTKPGAGKPLVNYRSRDRYECTILVYLEPSKIGDQEIYLASTDTIRY